MHRASRGDYIYVLNNPIQKVDLINSLETIGGQHKHQDWIIGGNFNLILAMCWNIPLANKHKMG